MGGGRRADAPGSDRAGRRRRPGRGGSSGAPGRHDRRRCGSLDGDCGAHGGGGGVAPPCPVAAGAEEPAAAAAVNMFTGPVVSLMHAKMKFYKLLRAKAVKISFCVGNGLEEGKNKLSEMGEAEN
ncbi:uncharacterized protein J5F26_016735 isoform 2-T4 [Ciconia maguari]